MFNNIWILTKKNISNINPLKVTIDFLLTKKKKIFLSENAINNLKNKKYKNFNTIDYSKKIDLIIVFWWDWSILKTNKKLSNFNTKIIWVNMWKLWFLSEVNPNNILWKLKQIFDWNYQIDNRSLLYAEVIRWKKIIKSAILLNEIVISYKDIARLISIRAKINSKILANYHSDWLIVSTSTWSTAYNISAWGPILYPKIPAFVLTPICSHSFTQKPIVVPDDKNLSFEITKSNKEKCLLTLDGQSVYTLQIWDIVKVKKYKETLKFIRFPWEHFYKIIKNKLKWWESL